MWQYKSSVTYGPLVVKLIKKLKYKEMHDYIQDEYFSLVSDDIKSMKHTNICNFRILNNTDSLGHYFVSAACKPDQRCFTFDVK